MTSVAGLLTCSKTSILQGGFSECGDHGLGLLDGVVESRYLQKVFEEKLDAVRIARDKEDVFKLGEFFHFLPHTEHRGTGIIRNAVDSIRIMICDLIKMISKPLC